ncbi:hypothetical protein H0H93_001512 [Arthromyces matolae]|nr:hypothetical protein H0H93_001512 [Arthromyces matolae]
MLLQSLVVLALAISPSLAAQPVWGQCGGINWTGDTMFAGVYNCYIHKYDHEEHKYDHEDHKHHHDHNYEEYDFDYLELDPRFDRLCENVCGNAYWVGLTGLSTANMNAAFADIAKAGGTTVRTWGFNEVTSANGIYYQSWSGSTPTINTGSTGLQNFDNVVAAAKANGIRLIVALTNNWSDYGGMDVYVKQILGSSNHDLFYTDSSVQTAYKNYVKTGSEGVDFDANLAISTVDFGTFHSYPIPWGQSSDPQGWGTQWIADHATSQTKANKPVILEEFGVTSNQATVYTAWWNEVVSSGIAGDLICGDTPNDGYAVYPDGAVYPILTSHAAALKARA